MMQKLPFSDELVEHRAFNPVIYRLVQGAPTRDYVAVEISLRSIPHPSAGW